MTDISMLETTIILVCRETLEDQCAVTQITGAVSSLYDLDKIPFAGLWSS